MSAITQFSQNKVGTFPRDERYDPKKCKLISVKNDSDNFSAVVGVFQKYVAPLYGSQKEALKKIGDREDRRCESLFYDDKLVGVMVYKKGIQKEYSKQGLPASFELKSLVIVEAKHKKHFKNVLMNRVLKLATRSLAKTVHVTVSERSKGELQFFNSRGFEIIETWNGRYIPGVKEYLLSLNIPKKKGSLPKKEDRPPEMEEKKVQEQDEKQRKRKRGKEEAPRQAEDPSIDSSKRNKKERKAYQEKDHRYYGYRGYERSSRSSDYSRQGQSYDRQSYRGDTPRGSSLAVSSSSRSRGAQRHEITLMKKYLHQIKYSGKTIEGRINSGMIRRFREGDDIRFFYKQNQRDDVTCKMTRITPYSSFKDMLETEGYEKCLTDVRSLADAVRVYDKIPGYSRRAAQHGVVAIELEVHK